MQLCKIQKGDFFMFISPTLTQAARFCAISCENEHINYINKSQPNLQVKAKIFPNISDDT